MKAWVAAFDSFGNWLHNTQGYGNGYAIRVHETTLSPKRPYCQVFTARGPGTKAVALRSARVGMLQN
jgi:hypothetical protein